MPLHSGPNGHGSSSQSYRVGPRCWLALVKLMKSWIFTYLNQSLDRSFMANLLQFVPQRGRRFEILIRNGFSNSLQPFELFGQILALLEHLGHFSQCLVPLCMVLSKPPGLLQTSHNIRRIPAGRFLEISLRKATMRAFKFRPGRLLHLLGAPSPNKRSASENPVGSSTPLAFEQVSHKSTFFVFPSTIWVR